MAKRCTYAHSPLGIASSVSPAARRVIDRALGHPRWSGRGARAAGEAIQLWPITDDVPSRIDPHYGRKKCRGQRLAKTSAIESRKW
jgi:hypothetical protein